MTTDIATRQQFVALTPQELPGAQAGIADWCRAKIIELSHELRDARQNMRQAKAMLWRYNGWQTVIRKTTARMLYYVKIKTAVEAGYLIVPNFPAEILAVRVDRDAPSTKYATYPTQINEAKPDLSLPPGAGRYVDETLPHEDRSFTNPQNTVVRRCMVDKFDEEIDFPATLIKPVILSATQRAMSLKVFDRIAVSFGGHGSQMSSRQRRADPIVLGQILDGSAAHPQDKRVTFFIAWWLDTNSL